MKPQQGSMTDNEWNQRRVYDSDSMSDVERLLTAMKHPSMPGMTHPHSYDTSDTEDEHNLARGNFKPSQSETPCGKLSTQAVKREMLECLIRSRCGSLAEHLCGSVSGLLEEEAEPTRVERNGERINRRKTRYPRNGKNSKADKDVITVRRLVRPEREMVREVEGLDHNDVTRRGRDLCKNEFTKGQHLPKDVDRHVTSGEDSNEEALDNPMYSKEGYKREETRRQFSHDFQENTCYYQSPPPMRDVSNKPSKSFKKSLRLMPNGFTCSETLKHGFSPKPKVNLPESNMSEGFSKRASHPSRPDARGDHCNFLLQPTEFPLSFPTVTSENMPTDTGYSFTKFPIDPREPDYDVNDGQNKSVRVPTRGVLKHNHTKPKTKIPALKRNPVPIKPIVSKHPELTTIAEERERKVSANITLTPRLSDYTQNFFPVEDQQLDDTMRLRFDEEIKPTYQKPPTLNMRKEFCASRWDPPKSMGKDACTQVSDSDVLGERERFNEERANVRLDKQVASFRLKYRPSVENEVKDVTRNELETEPAIEYPETDKVDLRWKYETGSEYETAESKATSMNSHMSAESSRENGTLDMNSSFAVKDDSELRGADVRTTDDVKVAEQIPSANDVSLLVRSSETPTPCATSTSSKLNAFSFQKSPIWENILFGGDKLNYEKEIAVLLWMCDLSDQLEQRSRASVDRMRAVVRMGDVTLRKLRLLKDSLLNVKVTEGGGAATRQMMKRQ